MFLCATAHWPGDDSCPGEVALEVTANGAGDSEAFGLADIAFHLAIIEGARHDLFSNIMQGLLPKLGVRFMRETYIEEGLEEKILDEHRSICRALERGEGTLAAKLLKLHLTASRRHLEKLLTRPI